jgi:hypothetical protein
MYPNRSTFRSAARRSLWWYGKYEDRWDVGVANGFALLHGLLMMLQLRLTELQFPAMTEPVDGVMPSDLDLSGRSGWNRTVLQALHAVIAHDHPDPVILQAISDDIAQAKVSATTARAAIWFTYMSTTTVVSDQGERTEWSQGTPDDILLDADTLLPVYGWPMPWVGANVNEGELPVMGIPYPLLRINARLGATTGPHPLLILGGMVLLFGGLYASEP